MNGWTMLRLDDDLYAIRQAGRELRFVAEEWPPRGYTPSEQRALHVWGMLDGPITIANADVQLVADAIAAGL